MPRNSLVAAFNTINSTGLEQNEKAVEHHVESAFQHLKAAVHLLSQRRRRIFRYSSQEFLKEAFSILLRMQKNIPSYISSQPDILVYTEDDFTRNLGEKIKGIEVSLMDLSLLSKKSRSETEDFEKEAERIGSELVSCVSSYIGDLENRGIEVQTLFEQLKKDMSGIIQLAEGARLVETLRKPGFVLDISRAYDCMLGFIRSYSREKREQVEVVSRANQVRKRRQVRQSVSGPSTRILFE